MTVNIDDSVVNGMADDADEAALAMGDCASLLHDDTAAATAGLSGFAMAEQLESVQRSWDRKARACRDSIELFSQALRGTAAALVTRDTDNAATFVFPDGSPIARDSPPWRVSTPVVRPPRMPD